MLASTEPHICVPDRVQKLKQARQEASKAIEEYRKAKEEEFKNFEASVCSLVSPHALSTFICAQHAGTTSNAQIAVDSDTELKLKAISESFQENKDEVIGMLLERVVLVEPQLHRNLVNQSK